MSEKVQLSEQAKQIIVDKIREAHQRVVDEIGVDSLVDMWSNFTREQLIALSHGIAFNIRTDLCTPEPVEYMREVVAGVRADYIFYDEDLRQIVPQDPFMAMSPRQRDRYLNDALVMLKPPNPMDYMDKGMLLLTNVPDHLLKDGKSNSEALFDAAKAAHGAIVPRSEPCETEVTCPICRQMVEILADRPVNCPHCGEELKADGEVQNEEDRKHEG